MLELVLELGRVCIWVLVLLELVLALLLLVLCEGDVWLHGLRGYEESRAHAVHGREEVLAGVKGFHESGVELVIGADHA